MRLRQPAGAEGSSTPDWRRERRAERAKGLRVTSVNTIPILAGVIMPYSRWVSAVGTSHQPTTEQAAVLPSIARASSRCYSRQLPVLADWWDLHPASASTLGAATLAPAPM